jgi:hypothetical protein
LQRSRNDRLINFEIGSQVREWIVLENAGNRILSLCCEDPSFLTLGRIAFSIH